jgi:small-conductance mechanosensitive channel
MRWKVAAATILLVAFALSGRVQAQSLPLPQQAKASQQSVVIPENATPDQVAGILGAMSDEQVRSVLLDYLQKDAAARQQAERKHGLGAALHHIQKKVLHIRDRFAYVFSGARLVPHILPRLFVGDETGAHPVSVRPMVVGLAVLTALWTLLLWGFGRLCRPLRQHMDATPAEAGLFYRMTRMFTRLGVELGIVVLAMLVLACVYVIFLHEPGRQRPMLMVWIVAVLLFEAVRLVARLLFAPSAPGLRLLPLRDETARTLSRYSCVIAAELGLGILVLGVVQLFDTTLALYLLATGLAGLLVSLTLVAMALANAHTGAEVLSRAFLPGTLRYRLAGSWHVFFSLYVLFFWAFWVVNLVAFGYTAMLSGLLTLLVVPAYLLLSWVVDRMVVYAGEIAGPALLEKDQLPSDPKRDFVVDEHGAPLETGCPVARLRRFLHKMFSVVLFSLFVLVMLEIWGINLPVARRVAEGALSVLVTLVLAYIFWTVARAAIEKKLRGQAEADEESEEGGHGGDRLATLLELLKRFTFAVLVVVVVLIVLSSLGVNTGPLLAGAGVFGIAIGFGSQTLVKDIISGVFFLMDDAFRVGDYIQLSHAKGTVEEISVRSMKLRHHLGMLYTVPYGSIREVRNMTRDWSVMKLEYLVPFDTDIQHVKKIVKRINKEIKAIPELAGGMLGDIKSQGVKAMEEYGMRMRIKFMTKPGHQFTIRKLVLAKLRRYFEEEGLQFAYRKVSVALPSDARDDRQFKEQVGAAVAQAVEEEEKGQDKH